MEFGERVKAARKTLGWSQQTLAEKVGTTQSTVDRIEKGHSRSHFAALMAGLLGIEPPSYAGGAITMAARGDAQSRQTMPVYPAKEGADGTISIHLGRIGVEERPAILRDVDEGFGFVVPDYEMFPAFEAGDVALVHPGLTLVRSCDVLLSAEEGFDEEGPKGSFDAALRRLVDWDRQDWIVQTWAHGKEPPAVARMSRTQWPSAMRVVGKLSRP